MKLLSTKGITALYLFIFIVLILIFPKTSLAANCSISPTKVESEKNVTVNGFALSPQATYVIYFNDQNQGTAVADFSGQFKKSIKAIFNTMDPVTVSMKKDGTGSSINCGTLTPLSTGFGGGTSGSNPCDAAGCNTAIGKIPTNPQAFAGKILSIAIGIAGGIALILMVVGSIRVLTSSGDQQKLSGGRDMIVAAVAGLLFLIFSVLILRFIGVEILGLL